MLALHERRVEDKRSTSTLIRNSLELATFSGEVECGDELGMPLELDAGVEKLGYWKGMS
jgi:hypothetical protein